MTRRRTVTFGIAVTTAVTTLAGIALAGTATAAAPSATSGATAKTTSRSCPPSAVALGYSDALNKRVYDGAEVGGLSSLAYDRRSHAWVSATDNNGSQPERIWFFRNIAHPTLVRAPLILRKPDGTPYNGLDSDNEGMAVLPDGDYLVSSETEPSIRIYGRNGVQKASLPIPRRFDVSPKGQATDNKTLEALTITPDGRTIVAGMEGALSGDVVGSDINAHRFLVYRQNPHGSWQLAKELGYRTDTGNRIPEIAAYTDDNLVVEEAAYSPAVGNTVDLYAVTGINRARDVTHVSNLGAAPAREIVHKTLIANLVKCPTLGAPEKEHQTNPLLDNFEGMAITFRSHDRRNDVDGISMISDDNFSPDQTTRVLNLVARLPS